MRTVAQVAALVTLAAACGSRGRPAPGPERAAVDSALLPVDRPGVVGMLIANGRRSDTSPGEYCVEDQQLLRGAPMRVARLNVFGVVADRALFGKHVVVYGEQRGSLLEALAPLGPCREGDGPPTAQMRSDWMAPEGGYATTRSRLSSTPYLQGDAVRELALSRVLADGADEGFVVVELLNPFAVPLDGLTARVRYEGGPGKPMPKWLPLALTLPPGGVQRVELAPAIDAGGQPGKPRRHGTYRLHGIDLAGELGALHFEVFVPLGQNI